MSGNVETKYEVVFPYEEDDYGNWNRIEPQYNCINGQCVNSIFVDAIFNTYEEALNESNKMNNELFNKKIIYLSSDNFIKNVEKIRKDSQVIIDHYKNLEQLIEQKTDDLKVNEVLKEQTIVIIGDGKKNKYNISLYEAFGFWKNEKYIVYNLTESEYIEIVDAIENNSTLDKFNKRCLIINNPDQNIIKIHNNTTSYLTPTKLIYRDKKEYNEINFDETENKITIYTLETYEDIIKSFLTKSDKDEIILNNKVMAKKLRIDKKCN